MSAPMSWVSIEQGPGRVPGNGARLRFTDVVVFAIYDKSSSKRPQN